MVVTGAWLAWRAWRTGEGGPQLRAIFVGALVWLPWSPVFVFQALHTGTPWTSPASAADLLGVFGDFSGGGPWGGLLMFATFALFVLGVFGRAVVPGTEIDTLGPDGDPQRSARPAGGHGRAAAPSADGSARRCGDRHAGPGRGARAPWPTPPSWLATRRWCCPCSSWWWRRASRCCPADDSGSGAWRVLTLAGLLTGHGENGQQRTQAAQVAAVLNVQAQAGDLVVYCPDQLGPAVDRLLRGAGCDRDHLSEGDRTAAGRLGRLQEGHRRHGRRTPSPRRPWLGSAPATPCGWSGGTAIPVSAATAAT